MLRAVLMSQPLRQHGGNWTHRYILVDNLSLSLWRFQCASHRLYVRTLTHARAMLTAQSPLRIVNKLYEGLLGGYDLVHQLRELVSCNEMVN